jgi:hypothetical protein
MPLNAYESGFQNNTTITQAFWHYKPDFAFQHEGKEIGVNINRLQYFEFNQPTIRMPQITNVAINAGVITVTGVNTFQSNFNAAIMNGLQNATFLNGLIIPVNSATPQQFMSTMPPIVAPVTDVMVSSNVLTVVAKQQWVVGMTVTFSNLVNATFLNAQTVTIASVSRNFADPSGYASFTAAFTHADYGTAGCGSGNEIGLATLNTNGYNAADSGNVSDPKDRQVWLYYDQTSVSDSQRAYILKGIPAQAFINDMEALFG